MGDPVRGGDGGLTNPHHCLNCHGAPETQFDSRQNLPYAIELQGPGSVLMRTPVQVQDIGHLGDCAAKDVWPEALKQYQPELAPHPFWVRSNFEKTLKAYRSEIHKPTLPFRMDVGEAEITLDLRPESFSASVLAKELKRFTKESEWVEGVLGFFKLQATPNAKIFSHWQVHGNYLNLGVQNMLRVNGVTIKAGPFEVSPKLIALDPSGQLHGKFLTNGWAGQALWGLNEFVVDLPQADPPYYADPACLAFSVLPQCSRPGPFEDLALNQFLPAEIKFPDIHTIPQTFLLEDFILKLLEALPPPKKQAAPGQEDSIDVNALLKRYLYLLKPGSEVRVNLKDLKDFFIPNVLDLGPSHSELIVQVDPHHDLSLTLEDMDLRLDAMGLGSLKITTGHIQPGEPVEVEHHGVIRPGLHLVRSTATGNIELEGNLKIELELEGGAKLNAHALLKGTLLAAPKDSQPKSNFLFSLGEVGYQLTPDFFLSLRDTDFIDPSGKPRLTDSKFEINAVAYPLPWSERPLVSYINQGATLDLDLNMSEGRKVKGEGITTVTPNQWGGVDFRTLLHGLDFMTQVDYLVPEAVKGNRNYRADLHLYAEAARREIRPGEEAFPLGIELKLEDQDLDKKTSAKLLAGLLGHLEILANLENKGFFEILADLEKNLEKIEFRGGLEVKADAINFPGVMKKGLFFKDSFVDLQVEGVKVSKGLKAATISKFKVGTALNPDKKGMVQGVATVAQKVGTPVRVQWLPVEEQWKVENLDLKAQLEKVRLDNRWLKSDSLFPLPQGQSFGGDARFQIDFLLNTKGGMKNWNGAGKILLLGDERGEIYLTNSRGEQVGAPIFRNTHWRFSKLHRIDMAGGYPLVDAELVTNINTSALSPIGPNLASKLEGAGFDPEWFERFAQGDGVKHNWESGETQIKLCYDNQPLTPEGFLKLTTRYLQDQLLGTHPKQLMINECKPGGKGQKP